MSAPDPNPKTDPNGNAPRPNWRPTFFGWFAAMLVAGAIGAGVSIYLGVPAFLGGLFCLVLVGMCGAFAVAARVARG